MLYYRSELLDSDSGVLQARIDRLLTTIQWAEATFDALPFDIAAARSYGRVYALVCAGRRQPRSRLADLMIASVAAANQLPLYTRNPSDFAALDSMITVVAV